LHIFFVAAVLGENMSDVCHREDTLAALSLEVFGKTQHA
jgi:hypothetical protein